jgi:aminopeptidase N
MRRAVALACFVVGCGGCGGSDPEPPPTGPIAATVSHYDYKFDIDSRAAHATVTATVDTAGDCWKLPFRGQDLANVTLDGVAAKSATPDASSVTVCGEGYRAGATLVLDADLTIPLATLSTSQVGYSITKDAAQNSFYYLVSWVGGCDRFTPCDNRPDVFATYRFTVTHPANFQVRCPGTVTDGATETVCDFTLPGGPTYSTFGVAAYPAWTMTDKGMWGGVHVTVYDRSANGIAAALDSAYHGGFIDWMTQQFGPFPFGTELRVLTAPTYWAGFEHPGNIVLDDGLRSGNLAHVMDHEMAHQWAGDQTTLADTYDFVWKESMAEYLSYVYEDMKNPAFAAGTAAGWKSGGAQARYFPVPLGKPALFDYYGDVYGPGPMILFRQLEVQSSRQQVLAALKSVLGQPHTLSVDELVAALQRETGIDLTDYTAAWIKGTGAPLWPRFSATFTPGAGTSHFLLHQLNPSGKPRACKFHVALNGANADETTSLPIDFHDGADVNVDLPTPAFTVTSIQLDPATECMVFLDSSMPRTRVNPWLSARGRALTAP